MTYLANVPTQSHYAILTEASVTIPGDERSRTHPGHGYPEETKTYIEYEVFEDRTKWEQKIEKLERMKSKYRAIEAHPAKVETTVSVKVSRS